MFLYKLYNIFSEHNQPKTSELVFIQEEITNLKKALKMLQSLVKITLFYLLLYYKTF